MITGDNAKDRNSMNSSFFGCQTFRRSWWLSRRGFAVAACAAVWRKPPAALTSKRTISTRILFSFSFSMSCRISYRNNEGKTDLTRTFEKTLLITAVLCSLCGAVPTHKIFSVYSVPCGIPFYVVLTPEQKRASLDIQCSYFSNWTLETLNHSGALPSSSNQE